ncbi:hypothetical protein [Kineococcus rhizosphaerae]|uniref:Alpha/beta hydrolase n=1 Tax=Kineococcus rhizosphaerae TaxID=559628 RepID=A0A2T0QXG1_9ACTN|nr:hypothetical protein [Kineococcus rhizosphaerae]PRY10738.1 hypothetical protein CLV37_1152 [Kineococcus rhizosphaerae]
MTCVTPATSAGPGTGDPTLPARLSAAEVPALVVWAASDRIVNPG